MEFSVPPNEASQKIKKIFGLDESKVVGFEISVKHGEVPKIEITQLITVEELNKVVKVLRMYKFKEE